MKRRDKVWWGILTAEESSTLVRLERCLKGERRSPNVGWRAAQQRRGRCAAGSTSCWECFKECTRLIQKANEGRDAGWPALEEG